MRELICGVSALPPPFIQLRSSASKGTRSFCTDWRYYGLDHSRFDRLNALRIASAAAGSSLERVIFGWRVGTAGGLGGKGVPLCYAGLQSRSLQPALLALHRFQQMPWRRNTGAEVMGAEVSATVGLAEVASPLVVLLAALPRLALSVDLAPLRGVALLAVASSLAFAVTASRASAYPRLASAWASVPTITMTRAMRGRRTATGGFAVTTTDVAARSSPVGIRMTRRRCRTRHDRPIRRTAPKSMELWLNLAKRWRQTLGG